MYVCEVSGKLALLLWRAHANEMHVRKLRCLFIRCSEAQTSVMDVLFQDFLKSRLVEGDFTGFQLREFCCIDIDTQDFMTKFCHTGGVGRAEVTRPKDCDSGVHFFYLRLFYRGLLVSGI
ncbi:hypothetical protein A5767_01485 [Rhodococcus sp. 852002-51564_SCH6189132-a]|nr:hypothetical protein A5767_01485 [Rhodococcus sp. 852002-51564_SCH6189132-a]